MSLLSKELSVNEPFNQKKLSKNRILPVDVGFCRTSKYRFGRSNPAENITAVFLMPRTFSVSSITLVLAVAVSATIGDSGKSFFRKDSYMQ